MKQELNTVAVDLGKKVGSARHVMLTKSYYAMVDSNP